MRQNSELRISVTPEPDDREKAAIVAAVVASAPKVQDDEVSRPANRWREAGKREALRQQIWETHS